MSNDQLVTKESDEDEHRLAKKIKNFIYHPHDLVGSGFSSQVFKGINQNNLQPIAIKVIELSKIQNEVEKYLLNNEITSLRILKHKNVLQTVDILMTKNNVYIVTEYCEQGDLHKLISKKQKSRENDSQKKTKYVFNEWQALNIVRDIVQGYRAIEEKNILHRDLKSANIFITKGTAKIADFGFCQIRSQTTKKPQMNYNVGSPAYMSPQSYKENIYSHKSDIWSIGIILYEMLYGETPDKTLTYDQMASNMISGKYKGIESEPMKNILQRIFKKDLSQRIGSNQLLQIVNTQIKRFIHFKNQTATKNTMSVPHTIIPNIRQSQIIPDLVKDDSQAKLKFPRNTQFKTQQKYNQISPKYVNIGMSPKNIKHNQNFSSQIMIQQKQTQSPLRPSIELLLFLYRLLKLVSQTSIQPALMTRLIIFRHRSFIDQSLPTHINHDQSFQQFQYLKSKFDETYIQKEVNFPSNHPTVILLNQHTNSAFKNPSTISVYQNILKDACESCSNYIFGVGTVEESVIDFNRIGTMWDYLMVQHEILMMVKDGRSVLQIVEEAQLSKITKEQPKKLTHKHYQLLKLKNDWIIKKEDQNQTQMTPKPKNSNQDN